MADISILEKSLWWMATGGEIVAFLKLVSSKLVTVYRCFSIYLIAIAIRSLVLMQLPVHGTAYTSFWMYSEPVIWLLQIGIVVELYSLVLNHYSGLQRIRLQVLNAILALAVLVSALTLYLDVTQTAWRYPLLQTFFLLKRWICSLLLVFLLLMTVLLLRYSSALSRNVVLHARIFTMYFLSYSLGYFAINVGVDVRRQVSVVLLGVACCCLLAWTLLLSKAGQDSAVVSNLTGNQSGELQQAKSEALQFMKDFLRRHDVGAG
jgi:hypothetical protein